jgi:hypothetical protein
MISGWFALRRFTDMSTTSPSSRLSTWMPVPRALSHAVM